MKSLDKKSPNDRNKKLKTWEKIVKIAQVAEKYHIPKFLIKFLFEVLKHWFFG